MRETVHIYHQLHKAGKRLVISTDEIEVRFSGSAYHMFTTLLYDDPPPEIQYALDELLLIDNIPDAKMWLLAVALDYFDMGTEEFKTITPDIGVFAIRELGTQQKDTMEIRKGSVFVWMLGMSYFSYFAITSPEPDPVFIGGAVLLYIFRNFLMTKYIQRED